MKYQTISMKQFFSCERRDLLRSHRNGDIFTCENNMLLSLVRISCFRAKAKLVFHWCLYNKMYYFRYRKLRNVDEINHCLIILGAISIQ